MEMDKCTELFNQLHKRDPNSIYVGNQNQNSSNKDKALLKIQQLNENLKARQNIIKNKSYNVKSPPSSAMGSLLKKNEIEGDPHLKPLVLMDKTIENRQLNKIWSPKYTKPQPLSLSL